MLAETRAIASRRARSRLPAVNWSSGTGVSGPAIQPLAAVEHPEALAARHLDDHRPLIRRLCVDLDRNLRERGVETFVRPCPGQRTVMAASRCTAANRLEVLVEEHGRRSSACIRENRSRSGLPRARRTAPRDRARGRGCCSPMAGETGHARSPCEVALVDRVHHRDHAAGADDLRRHSANFARSK